MPVGSGRWGSSTLRESGSALLLVVGATAALGTLAVVLLAVALTLHDAAGFRRDGTEARLLADSAVREAAARLAAGELDPGAAAQLEGTLPAPPAGFDPLRAAAEPAPGAPPGGGCGYRIEMVPVVDADGQQRTKELEAAPGAALLVDVATAGWCGRGRATASARLAVAPDGSVHRLH